MTKKYLPLKVRWKSDGPLFVTLLPMKKHLGPGDHPSGTPQSVHNPEHEAAQQKGLKAQLRHLEKWKGADGEHLSIISAKIGVMTAGYHVMLKDKNEEDLWDKPVMVGSRKAASEVGFEAIYDTESKAVQGPIVSAGPLTEEQLLTPLPQKDVIVPRGTKTFAEYKELVMKHGIPMKWKPDTKEKTSWYDLARYSDETTWDDFDFVAWQKTKNKWTSDEGEPQFYYSREIPKELVPVGHQLIGTAQLMHKYQDKQNSLKDYGFDWAEADTPEKYVAAVEKLLQDEMDKNRVFLRTTPGKLEDIIQQGEYLNMFQRGGKTSITTSGKGFTKAEYGEKRKRGEYEILGIPLDAPNDARPVYGYISKYENGRLTGSDTDYGKPGDSYYKKADPLEDDTWLEQYGSVAIRLKKEKHQHVTWTGGDSLDSHGTVHSSPLSNASYFSLHESYDARALIFGDQSGKSIDSDWSLYWEAQIFGGVRVSDIDHVFLKQQPSDKLVKRLKKAGIPWTVTG